MSRRAAGFTLASPNHCRGDVFHLHQQAIQTDIVDMSEAKYDPNFMPRVSQSAHDAMDDMSKKSFDDMTQEERDEFAEYTRKNREHHGIEKMSPFELKNQFHKEATSGYMKVNETQSDNAYITPRDFTQIDCDGEWIKRYLPESGMVGNNEQIIRAIGVKYRNVVSGDNGAWLYRTVACQLEPYQGSRKFHISKDDHDWFFARISRQQIELHPNFKIVQEGARRIRHFVCYSGN